MRKVQIINLTDHPIHLMDKNREILHTFPPSGVTARCPLKTETEEIVQIADTEITVAFTKTNFNRPVLPDPKPFTYYIVSEVVARGFSGIRDDLRIVNGLIKDNGKTIGCRSLGRV